MWDRLFGRDEDLAAIDELAGAPLVTIVGPPGVGKTRIAREVASRKVATRTAWFVSLAEARDEASATSAILATLGGRDAITASHEAVLDAIRAKGDALVVLDNVEHLDLGSLLTTFVRDPDRTATIVCTSRRVLGVQGEVVWTLEPLRSVDDALAMLLDRVRRIYPTYAPSDDELVAARSLVDRVDRLPLAIELLAPQLRILSASELLASRRWDLLAGDTLRTAFESSLASLAADARGAFEEATLFRGGFTLDAAEHVLSVGKGAASAIRALLDGSLLFATGQDARRFQMLEVVRELSPVSSDLASARERHTHYYLEHCEAVALALRTGKRGARVELEAEIENLTAVHGHAVRTGTADAALSVATIVEDVTPFPLRSALIDAAMALRGASPTLLARAHLGRAAMRRMQGDWAGSGADAEAARAIGERIGAPSVQGLAHVSLGAIAKHQGAYAPARAHYERSLVLFRAAGDCAGEAEALGFVAHCLLEEGAFEEARVAGEAALKITVASGDEARAGHAHSRLANILLAQGARAEAAVHYEQALAIMRYAGPGWAVAGTLMNYALLAQEEGGFERSISMLEEALRIFGEERSGSRHEVLARVQLAWLRVECQKPELALEELARVRIKLPAEPRNRALYFSALGCAEAMLDHHDAARAAFASAHGAASAGAIRDAVHVAEGVAESHCAIFERARGNAGVAAELEERARQRLAHAAEGNDDARLAARILKRTLEPKVGRPMVFADGKAFVTSAGTRVALDAFPLLARLVRLLAAAGSRIVTTVALVDQTWPDEKMTHSSAQNRLRVAMSRLRRMGLPLVAKDGGYSLAEDTQVVHDRGSPPNA